MMHTVLHKHINFPFCSDKRHGATAMYLACVAFTCVLRWLCSLSSGAGDLTRAVCLKCVQHYPQRYAGEAACRESEPLGTDEHVYNALSICMHV